MNINSLKKEGFSDREARIISAYAKAGQNNPMVQKLAQLVKATFRTITWLTLTVIILYFLCVH